MVTARAAFGTTRPRRPAGPLRLLWLSALLFAFLYTHAAGADSASAHVTGGAVAVPHQVPAETGGAHGHDGPNPDGRDDGSGHSHPAEACASGHPQQGVGLPVPHLVPLGEQTPAFAAMTPQPWTQTLPCGLPPLRSSLSSVVQQV
uniref:Secreted protein n=1 Tax=Streptomyces sp. NBC_00049 TaxID=2903617 RepID=A0AAU2JIA7_9ACTN